MSIDATFSSNQINELVNRVDVIDKVKKLPLLPDNTHTSISLLAQYFGVTDVRIIQLIKEHNDGIVQDGMKMLSGEELMEYRTKYLNGKYIPKLKLIPKKSAIRLAMSLRNSPTAKKIRAELSKVKPKSSNTAKQIKGLRQDIKNQTKHIEELESLIKKAMTDTTFEVGDDSGSKFKMDRNGNLNLVHSSVDVGFDEEKVNELIEKNETLEGEMVALMQEKNDVHDDYVTASQERDSLASRVGKLGKQLEEANKEKRALKNQLTDLSQRGLVKRVLNR